MNANGTRGGDVAELARLLPAPAERDLPAGRQQALKEYLMSELRLAGTAPAGRPAPRRRRRPAIIIAAAGAAAVAAAATALAAGLVNRISRALVLVRSIVSTTCATSFRPVPVLTTSPGLICAMVLNRPSASNTRVSAAKHPLPVGTKF